MKTILSDALNVSLESQTDDIASLSPEQVSLSLEKDTIELLSAGHELTVENYRMGSIESAIESLESIRLSIESTLQVDGSSLNKQTEVAYQHAVKAVLGDAIDVTTLSLESNASMESMDQIKAFIKRLIKALMDTAKKIMEFVRRILATIPRMIPKMVSKFNDLTRRLKARELEGIVFERDTASVENPGFDMDNLEDGPWKVAADIESWLTENRGARKVIKLATPIMQRIKQISESVKLGRHGQNFKERFEDFRSFSMMTFDVRQLDETVERVDYRVRNLQHGTSIKTEYIKPFELPSSEIPSPARIIIENSHIDVGNMYVMPRESLLVCIEHAKRATLGMNKHIKQLNNFEKMSLDVLKSVEENADLLTLYKDPEIDDQTFTRRLQTFLRYGQPHLVQSLTRLSQISMHLLRIISIYVESCVELYEKEAKASQ